MKDLRMKIFQNVDAGSKKEGGRTIKNEALTTRSCNKASTRRRRRSCNEDEDKSK